MPPIIKRKKRISGLPRTVATLRYFNCRPTGPNLMPPSGSGTTLANRPRTIGISSDPHISAKPCSAPFIRSNATPRRLPACYSHSSDHHVELLMRVYIVVVDSQRGGGLVA